MDKDTLRGGDLVIDAAVAFQVQESLRRYIIDKPADLVGMRFDHHLKRGIGLMMPTAVP